MDREEASKILIEAVNHGDMEGVKRALEQGADVRYENDKGFTAFDVAAIGGQVYIMRLLEQYGPDLYHRVSDPNGRTLGLIEKPLLPMNPITVTELASFRLLKALELGSDEEVKNALIQGRGFIDFNYRDSRNGDNLLIVAIEKEKTEFASYLLGMRKGVIDINCCNSDNITPLMLALEKGNDIVAQELLKRTNINVDARGPGNSTALTIVAEIGDVNIMKKVLTKAQDRTNITDGLEVAIRSLYNRHIDRRELYEVYKMFNDKEPKPNLNKVSQQCRTIISGLVSEFGKPSITQKSINASRSNVRNNSARAR